MRYVFLLFFETIDKILLFGNEKWHNGIYKHLLFKILKWNLKETF